MLYLMKKFCCILTVLLIMVSFPVFAESESDTTSQKSVEINKQEKADKDSDTVAKVKKIKPSSKSSWSKIKDLFM